MSIRTVDAVTDSSGDESMPRLVSDSDSYGDDTVPSLEATPKPAPKKKRRPHRRKKIASKTCWWGETGTSDRITAGVSTISDNSTPSKPFAASVRSTMEIFAGQGVLSSELGKVGFMANVVDLKDDPMDDMSQATTISALHSEAIVCNVRYAHFAPPCNTFSPARWPRIRTGTNQ